MEVRFWAATDTGRKRGHNEDNYLVDRALRLFVVCDGMGGHAAGEVASAAAIQSIRSALGEEGATVIAEGESRDEAGSDEEILDLLERAVDRANRRVWEMAQEDEKREGMGTTCSLMLFVGSRGFVAHVGDSRIYRLREGAVSQLTDDHSLRNHLIEQGKLGEEEAFDRDNPITRAVGVAEEVDVDCFCVDLDPGDRFVLCSDGLTEYLETPEVLGEIAGGEDLELATRKCIDHANRSGGKDNVTTIVAEVGRGSGVWDARQTSPAGRAIRELPHFAHLTPDQFGQVADRFEFRKYDQGAMLVRPGETPDELVVVAAGSVELTDGDQAVDVVGPGEVFGERALFGASPSSTAATVREPTAVAALPREEFESLLGEDHELAAKLAWNFLQCSMETLSHLETAWYRHPERLADSDRTTADLEVSERERSGGGVVSGESVSGVEPSGATGAERPPSSDEVKTRELSREEANVPGIGRGEGGGDSRTGRESGSEREDAETEQLVGILRDAAESAIQEESESGAPGGEGADGAEAESSVRETVQMESFDEDSTSRD